MGQDDIRWYNSAFDWWLAAGLVMVPSAAIAALAITLVEGEGVWAGALGVLFVVVIYGGLVVPVRYGLGADHLTVRFGLVRQRIPYRDIRRVQPTRNLLSAPALSLNRLRVESGGGFFRTVMISPARRDDFLDRLADSTGLEPRGDALLPSESSNAGQT